LKKHCDLAHVAAQNGRGSALLKVGETVRGVDTVFASGMICVLRSGW
jgi:hypothetical protein